MIRLLTLCIVVTLNGMLQAENWPGWRGPRGDGSSNETNVPIEWDVPSGKNVAWKIAVGGEGHSSPIVWGNRVFLTSCDETTTERKLACFDLQTGETIWERPVFKGQLETIHALNSRASGTPVTDGKHIFVAFMRTSGKMIPAPNVGSPRDITSGEMVVAAYDMEGERQWMVSPGDFVSAHGFSSCPVLFEDVVIVNGDHDGDSYVVALEKQTGKERWRYKRVYGIRSYGTPLIRQAAGRTQMVFSGSKRIISLDPKTGAVHWFVEGPTEQMVASMVFDGQKFYMNCGYPDYFVAAIWPNGSGDVTDSRTAWITPKARSYVPSPVVVGRYLIVADDRGTANCFDTQTGDRLWQERLGSGFHGSLIHANGLVYLIARDGATSIVRPGDKFNRIAENIIGEPISASPAISDGRLLIRTEESLICLRNDTGEINGQ
ncbi:MAG: PQQ-binding-like beta-propeller repeat protein [Planctomycetales bacterium]|nr:PQQ-binding-like beta-propeller repeat protein [Planctomycetales bacterium]